MKAIISGIPGQDASYLAKFLLEKGYEVIGTARRNSERTFSRLKSIGIKNDPNLKIVDLELTEYLAVADLIQKEQPDEFYNLAAQTFVADSFKNPLYTIECNGLAVANILESIRRFSPKTKLYQASTSEMFGEVKETPQNEQTPFNPISPYGVAKLLAHNMCELYRHSYNVFACCGILFNHESPLRGDEFVTKKITNYVTGNDYSKPLELGNIDSKRDWGFAGDYIEAMWGMLQLDKPDTYVIATGETHTVREFVEEAFKCVDIDIKWSGVGLETVGEDSRTGQILVKINPEFYRPYDVQLLLGDASKAWEKLGWLPKHDWKQLCKLMIDGKE